MSQKPKPTVTLADWCCITKHPAKFPFSAGGIMKEHGEKQKREALRNLGRRELDLLFEIKSTSLV
jgi:hypothetical protein